MTDDLKVAAKILHIVAAIIVTCFGIFCLFQSRYIEALLCGIYFELAYGKEQPNE